MGYAGTHAHIRGGQEICDAIALLHKEGGKRKYFGIILGAKADSKWIAQKRELPSYGIDFIISDSIPYEQVPYFISSFDIGISLLSERHRGASCQKVRQYIACNIFTISTPGQEEFISDYHVGRILENNDAGELSKAVIEYLDAPNNESLWDEVVDEIAYENINVRRLKVIFG